MPGEAWVFLTLFIVCGKYFAIQVPPAWKCHLLNLDLSTEGERKDWSGALAVACQTVLKNGHTLSLLVAPGILDSVLYCGAVLGRVGDNFSVVPRVWEQHWEVRAVSYQAKEVALTLLRREEDMNLTLASSALVSNDEHEGHEELSIVTSWIPASIALCFSLASG